MKFFKKFRSEKKDSQSFSFTENEINSWPSQPNEDLKVPPLTFLKENSLYKKEAKAVLEWGETSVQEGDEVEYQAVLKSQFGPLTLPALVKRKDGGFLVYYSHCSEWNDEAVAKLLDWVIKLRACDFIHTLKIEICDSPEKLPLKVKEIISKRTEHRMFISMLPHLGHKEADVRARVFAEGFGHFFDENKILNFDLSSLQQVEEWFKKTLISIAKDSFYYQICLNLLGSYFGRVLQDQLNGEWGEGDFPELIFGNEVKVRIQPYGIIGDFIFNPRLENSPVKNFQLINQEIKKNS